MKTYKNFLNWVLAVIIIGSVACTCAVLDYVLDSRLAGPTWLGMFIISLTAVLVARRSK